MSDENRIKEYLVANGEMQSIIDATLRKCAQWPMTKTYFLKQAIVYEQQLQEQVKLDAQITCHQCQHFNAIATHGRGIGHCLMGRQSTGASGLWWHSDCHECELFDLKF